MAGAVPAPCTVESGPRAGRDAEEFVMPSLISLGRQHLSCSQAPLELPFSVLGGSCPLSSTLASRYLSPGKSVWDRAMGPGSFLQVALLPLSEPTGHIGRSLSTSLPC